MGAKITYLYKVEMQTSKDGETLKTVYFYSRNASLIRTYCLENFKHLRYSYLKITKIGECKYTIREPIVEFNEQETASIEEYFMKEMVKYAYFQQQLDK